MNNLIQLNHNLQNKITYLRKKKNKIIDHSNQYRFKNQ